MIPATGREPNAPLRLGIIGAGRFAAFLADAISDLPEIQIHSVADLDPQQAERFARQHRASATADVAGMIRDSEIDAVIIATPPGRHHDLATTALRNGKHVFCEKPLALSTAEAEALQLAVAESGKVLVVDHVLRYNPLLRCLLKLQEQGLLGDVQRFCFENDAADEDLDPGHWFWDTDASGGIFLEHGVHFFDAAEMLIGTPATLVQATSAHREGEHAPVDLVSATVHHGPAVLATHTHSFTHAHRCERQLMRLDYGTAEARVEGWIPVEATLDIWTDDRGAALAASLPDRMSALFDVPGFRLDEQAAITTALTRDAAPGPARGRGRPLEVPHHARVRLTLGGPAAKPRTYTESVRAAMTDLVRAASSGHLPVSDVHCGARAVAVAAAATQAAASGTTVPVEPQPTITFSGATS